MKSNVCKIDKGIKDLEAIFKESERVAEYNKLTHKQTLQLRLLCEELDGMLPKIVDDFDGDLWFEFEDGVCKIKVTFKLAEINGEQKEELISIANNKKNAAAVGIVGKIRSVIEDFFLDEDTLRALSVSTGSFHLSNSYTIGTDVSYLWSLEQYRNSIKQEEQAEEWDELEKSVIASVADDVIVGIKGKKADIEIVKKFG